VLVALESPTPSVVDAALRSIPTILPVLDFTTIKGELFPVVANIFSKTNSLAIKVRGLQAFVILCGGSNDDVEDDGLDGLTPGKKKSSSSTALDKFAMQDKIVPLIQAIKTKEPAVMMAALNVLKVVGRVADAEFVAMNILPTLWSMSLGPLLDLKQFQTFMDLIRSLSKRVEDEQTKKLQELSASTNGAAAAPADDFMSFGGVTGTQFDATNGDSEFDFERLVKGKAASSSSPANPMDSAWGDEPASAKVMSPAIKSTKSPSAPAFSWSTPSPTTPAAPTQSFGQVKAQQPAFRTVTPDLASFTSLQPTSTQFSQPLQPAPQSAFPPPSLSPQNSSTSVNWSAASSNPWTASSTSAASTPGGSFSMNNSMTNMSLGATRPQMPAQSSSFSLPPPPGGQSTGGSGLGGFSLAPPPSAPQQPSYGKGLGGSTTGTGLGMGMMSNNSTGSMGMGSMSSAGAWGNTNNTTSTAGTSMNSMMGRGTLQPQQAQQQQPPQQQGRAGGLDKYASLL
jgi:SCY1-like protein 2